MSTPLSVIEKATITSRFWQKVLKNADDQPNDCWIWLGSKSVQGYGMITRGARHANPRVIPAHQVAWELNGGVVLANGEIHHKCFNPSCVNPAHLEIVTRKQHIAKGGLSASSLNVQKICCDNGHPFDAENTIYTSRGRICRKCKRLAGYRFRARHYNYHPRPLVTHCHDGHELTPENTYTTPDGRRQCKTCQRQRTRAWRSRINANNL